MNENTNPYLHEIYNEVCNFINEFNIDDIHKLTNLIIKYKKDNIYLLGVGKSGNIAKHFGDLLRSISINVFYLNTTNLLHGDIGNIYENNLIIMFSNSGKTEELINVIPYLKLRKVFICGICCNKISYFKDYCNMTIEIPFNQELSGDINKIPTNSVMNLIMFTNILISELKKNISLEDYKKNHPSGEIGNELQKIKDIIKYDFPKIISDDKIFNIFDIYNEMIKYKSGCCFFENKKGEFLGLLTDGDIRRLFISYNKNLININYKNINTNYYYEENIEKFLDECKKYIYIPILNDKKLIGIVINNTCS